MPDKFADDRFWNALQKENGGGHVAQVMNPQILYTGAIARRPEWLTHVPLVRLSSFETDVGLIGREDVFARSITGEVPKRSDSLDLKGEPLWSPVL